MRIACTDSDEPCPQHVSILCYADNINWKTLLLRFKNHKSSFGRERTLVVGLVRTFSICTLLVFLLDFSLSNTFSMCSFFKLSRLLTGAIGCKLVGFCVHAQDSSFILLFIGPMHLTVTNRDYML